MSSTVDAKKLQADESTNKKTDNIHFSYVCNFTSFLKSEIEFSKISLTSITLV